MNNWKDDILVFDTETNGFEEQDDIIEFSASFFIDGVFTNYTNKYKPVKPIPPEAAAVHFLTDEMLESYGSIKEELPLIEELFKTKKYFVGHNVGFDKRLVCGNFERELGSVPKDVFDQDNWICTLRFAKKIMYHFTNNFSKTSLSYLWFYYKLYKISEMEIVAHQAECDVYMCYKVLEHLIDIAIEEKLINPDSTDICQEVIRYCKEPIIFTHMPLGKHAGTIMHDVPMNYIEWMILNSDVANEEALNYDPDLAATLFDQIALRGNLN